jgi:L-threonylcarbamoyladenylate synthase
MPAHPVALHLLKTAAIPLAAPSANRSNQLSPTKAEHVLAGLDGRIDMVLDGGPTVGGLESTVLDLTTIPPRLLRPGLIGPAEIEAVIGIIHRPVKHAATETEPLRSPGMLGRHYAPRAALTVHAADGRAVVESLVQQGKKVGWVTFDTANIPGVKAVIMPRRPDEYAARLYAVLHDLDRAGVEHIVVERPPDDERWLAIHDRLRRASAH